MSDQSIGIPSGGLITGSEGSTSFLLDAFVIPFLLVASIITMFTPQETTQQVASSGLANALQTCTITGTQPCSNTPCQNGGSCVATGCSYRCDCLNGFSGDNCEAFWIGGTDAQNEGDWIWASNQTSITDTDWYTITGEPNNSDGNEHCMNIHSNLNFQWNDDVCDNNNRFICEKQLL